MTDRTCEHCDHPEHEHRGNGACMAVDKTDPADWKLCPCNDYEPGRQAPRSTLRNLGERGRAHERRMRKLRPEAIDRDRGRCLVGLAEDCTGRAEVVHHLWPSEKGGPDELANLLSSCEPCHNWVHNVDPQHARMLGLLRNGN